MKKLILFYLLCLCILNSNAGTYILSPPFFINGGYSPGDTLLLPAGLYTTSVRWSNLHGTEADPIVIMNTGGKVELRGDLAEGIKILNCSYLKISGSGHGGAEYGIHISYSGNGLPGINIKERSHHIEIEYVEIENTGFSGIMAKDDVANNVDTSAAYWKMKGLYFHHNYIHDIRLGEGIYVGSTQWARNSLQPGSHDIDDIRIYGNRLVNTPSEAIQVGACPDGDVEIFDNDIKNYGISPFEAFQANGIQLGNGFAGRCYNNRIVDGTSTGIIVLGVGDVYVYNNLIARSGALGIFSGHQTAEEGKNFYYYHNTIIDPGTYAIQFRAPNNNTGYFYNNIVLTGESKPTAIRQPIYLQYPLLTQGNFTGTIDIADDLFADASLDDYRLLNTAAVIDSGVEIAGIGLSLDHDIVYATRPAGAGYDAGAYEYIPDTVENQVPVALIDSVPAMIVYPQDSIRLVASASYDPDGLIVHYLWERKSGPGSPLMIPDPSGEAVWIKELTYGAHVFRLTVTDDLGAKDSAFVSLLVDDLYPVASAGDDLIITARAVVLSGAGHDPDGGTVSFAWSSIAGPGDYNHNATLHDASLYLTELIPGLYTFRLTVTDDEGKSAYDDIDILVNQVPVAVVSPDFSVTLPVDSVALRGDSSYDPDSSGYLIFYEWTMLSGPGDPGLSGAYSPVLMVSDLVAGVYVFQLVVTDNHFSTDTAEVALTVSGAPPIVSAGGDQSIYYPATSISLTGSGQDPDGYILSYEWRRVSGPQGYSVSGENSAILALSDLSPGEYAFALTVTDNDYTSRSDSMVLRVYGLFENEVLYRINCGGMKVSGAPIPWEKDMQIEPSSYLSSGSGNYTTGSLSWSGINVTGAPDSLFGGQRYQPSYASPLKWNFPVDSGWYEVRLYFAVKNGSQGSAMGERAFSVDIEGARVLANYDIYADAALSATVKSFMARVDDGALNIDFVREIGNPQVNAVEIIALEYGLAARERPALAYAPEAEAPFVPGRFELYPNPVYDMARLRLSGGEAEWLAEASVELDLIDLRGQITRTSIHERAPGSEFIGYAYFSAVPAGVYVARLKLGERYYFQRIVVLKGE